MIYRAYRDFKKSSDFEANTYDRELLIYRENKKPNDDDLKIIIDEIYKIKPGQNNGEVVGILLNDVINMDECEGFIIFLTSDKVRTGSKVRILQEGTIVMRFKNKKKIGTLLYYNKKGKLTNKPQLNQKPIAGVLSSDNDGWTKILFRWCGL
jgi:hypothetical protein